MILSYTPKSQEQMYIILPPKEINSHTNGERQGETTPIQTFYAITRKKNNQHILNTNISTSQYRNTYHNPHQRETQKIYTNHTRDLRSHIELKLRLSMSRPEWSGLDTNKRATWRQTSKDCGYALNETELYYAFPYWERI